MLPKSIRDRIWATYIPGQEIEKNPTGLYVEAAQAARRWIMENHPPKLIPERDAIEAARRVFGPSDGPAREPDEGGAFGSACRSTIPFGKYAGSTLARVGSSDDGLRYLDWMVGQTWLREPLKSRVETYLGNPTVARMLADAVGGA